MIFCFNPASPTKGNVEQLASPLDGAILQLDALFARNRKKEA